MRSGVFIRWSPRSCVLLFCQCETKCCAAIDCPLGPDSSSVAMNDPLHGGQAHARAFELVRGVKPLKCAEQLIRVGHVETRAIVADKVHLLSIILLGPKLDGRHRVW